MDLLDLAAGQHSAFTLDQARGFGLSDRQVEGLLRRGTIIRAAPAVYRLRGTEPTWHQQLMVAVLSMPGSMASHRASARLRVIDSFASASVEILIERGRRRRRGLRGVILHETTDLAAADIDERNGIPCTSLVRTLVDLPAVTDEFRAGVALDHAARYDPAVLDRVADRHREVARRGRDGTVALRGLLAERGLGDLVDSGFERKALRLILGSRLPRPVTQHHVTDGDFECWLDLAWPEHLVGMDFDSFRHHTGERAFRWERKRRRHLAAMGWTILEFTYREVTQEGETVLRELAEHLLPA